MKKFLLLTLALSAFSSMANASIYDLNAGDRLDGTDIVRHQNCSIEVVKKDTEDGKLTMTLAMTLGETRYQEFQVQKRFVVGHTMMFSQLSKVVDNVKWNTVTVDASLQEKRLNGERAFVLTRTVWGQGSYSPNKSVDCRF